MYARGRATCVERMLGVMLLGCGVCGASGACVFVRGVACVLFKYAGACVVCQ